MDDFENIISFENLYKAHRRARLGKRWKKEVIEFEAHLSENLWALHYDLLYGKYEVGGYHKFMIYDPKEREIQAISYRDRIVQHSLCDNYLMPLLDRRLIYDNCACRKDKGTHFAYKRLREFMVRFYKQYGKNGYFVKLDVKKYFPSIDHEVLLQKVAKLVNDEQILNLINKIVSSYNGAVGKGLPMGNQTSQCFALLYLDDIDRYIKEICKIKYYIRYMDDMIVIVHAKEQAKALKNSVVTMLMASRLTMNSKSSYFQIANGICFLGWRFYFSNTGAIIQKLRKCTKQRINYRIKMIKYYIQNGVMQIDNKSILKASYRGHLLYGNAHLFYNNICFQL